MKYRMQKCRFQRFEFQVFYDLMREIKRRKGGTLKGSAPGGDSLPRDKLRKKKRCDIL